MRRVHELGVAIERAWRDADYAASAFPSIAAAHLEQAALHRWLTLELIARWSLTTLELAEQADPRLKFGNPPVTLYSGSDFYIDALFWLDGTTDIHRHAFSGAFQVLAGSSLHTAYEFEETSAVSARMRVGHLRSRGSRLLRHGHIEKIIAGGDYIHSLFHLERPSISIVVRTVREVEALPQYSYNMPGLALDPFEEPDRTQLGRRVADLLVRLEHRDAARILGDAVAEGDAFHTFHLLKSAFGLERSAFEEVVARARERHGDLVDIFQSALAEDERENLVARKRAQVRAPEHRYFLALLLNVRSREEILRLTAEYVPGADPVETVLRWIREFNRVTSKLQVGGIAWEPNVMGLPELHEPAMDALEHALRGTTHAITLTDAQQRFLATMRQSPIFGVLLRG